MMMMMMLSERELCFFSLLLLSVRFMIHEEELLHDAKTTTMKMSC